MRFAKTSIAVAVFTSLALARSSGSWSDAWSKSKYGRASTAEATAARATETSSSRTVEVFRAKYGRYSPHLEHRQNEPMSNIAYREARTAGHGQTGWSREMMRAKHGRDLSK